MDRRDSSLLPGRRVAALEEREIRGVEQLFRGLGYDGLLEFDLEHGGKTRFVVRTTDEGEIGLIVVAADIFPGFDVANANSVLDPLPAVAHEITHYERWSSGRELPPGHLEDIDEAMTSLQAVCAFHRDLKDLHVEQLVSDALERLARYVREHPPTRDNNG